MTRYDKIKSPSGDKMYIDIEKISECIESQIEPEPFSGVVCISKSDQVIFERAYGLAIKSESVPNKTNTRFQIASGCKTFTAVAICQLAGEGKLKFETKLIDCLDESFPNYSPDITIHHLLTHSSGIASYYDENINPGYETVWQNTPMYNMRELKDFLPLFKNKPMKFSPGERFEYNDSGYILLGLIIESVTGMSFQTYVEQNIFKPAGMADSGYFYTDQLPERTAYSYIKNEDATWRTNFFAVPIIGGPDGGAYSTASDMARFWKAITDNRLMTTEMKEMMLKPWITTSKKPPYTHYGYGIWVDQQVKAVKKYFAEGLDPGVAFRSGFYTENNLILTIIGNTEHALWPLYLEIEKIITS
jgi:CubicO group peptidase (beta-lactamase class C family)